MNTGFPTRSHCHGWSCRPLQFFNPIILGIRQTQPGGKAFEISPWVNGLQNASGAMATPSGSVEVEWKISGKILLLRVVAPKTIQISVVPNSSQNGLTVQVKRKF